jgi:rRNA pseudouridine-1189 N-methylase Emg1 (Nep1/Mra1 family)
MITYYMAIEITVDEIKIIKRDLRDFLEETQGVIIRVEPDGVIEGKEELAETLKHLFIRLLSEVDQIGRQEIH